MKAKCRAIGRYHQGISVIFLSMLLIACSFMQAHAAEKVHDAVALSGTIQEQGTARVIVTFNIADYEPLHAASVQYGAVTPGTVAPAAAFEADAALAASIASGVDAALAGMDQSGVILLRTFKTIPSAVLKVDAAGLHALEDSSSVAYIEEDKAVPLPDPIDADNGAVPPLLSSSIAVIGADQAWAKGYDGTGWYVAILDTGILNTHSFFEGKNIVEACFSSKDETYNPDARLCPNGSDSQIGTGAAALYPSSNGGYDHGTHVAGIAAGHLADDSLNGVAKGADIIAVNVFSNGFTYTTSLLSYSSDQILGMEYVYSLRNAYSIASVNMSLGGGRYYATCDDSQSSRKAAIDNLRAAGIVTVIAAGNGGYCDSIGAPGCISTAPAIGATDNSDVRASFSNWNADLVPLFAPGVSIYSSTGAGDDSFGYKSGTSMATPHVCGAWAILKQRVNGASVDIILTALTSTAANVSFGGNCDDPTGIDRRISVIDALNSLSPAAADQPDILWRNPDNGKDLVWLMNGASYEHWDWLDSCAVGWEIVGTGDFDQDGNDDIVWRERNGERNAIWYMEQTTSKGWVFVDSALAGWKIRGVGDFNGDSNPDLVWRNMYTGRNCLWQMTNSTVDAIVFFDNRDNPWDIGGVGDFNGDGQPDILWRNPDTGANDVWFMDGSAFDSSAALTSADTVWSMVGVGDFNLDGQDDILWRRADRGKNCYWGMSGTSLDSVVMINDASSPWDAQGVGIFH